MLRTLIALAWLGGALLLGGGCATTDAPVHGSFYGIQERSHGRP